MAGKASLLTLWGRSRCGGLVGQTFILAFAALDAGLAADPRGICSHDLLLLDGMDAAKREFTAHVPPRQLRSNERIRTYGVLHHAILLHLLVERDPADSQLRRGPGAAVAVVG